MSGKASSTNGATTGDQAAALFQLGLALAIAHVTVALEIGATLSRQGSLVKSLVLLLYPVAVALLGFGAALDRIVLRNPDPTPALRASGALLVAFLFLALRVNFLSGDWANQAVAAGTHVVVLGAWFICAGVALARLVRSARAGGASSTGRLWAVHQVGLVVGYALQELLVPRVGASALHLMLGLSLLVPARLSLPVLLGGCLLAPSLDLDRRLDDLRDTSAVYQHDYAETRGTGLLEKLRAAGAGSLTFRHRAWSRLGQFELVEVEDATGHLAGWYNYQPQWGLRADGRGELRSIREDLYSLLPVDGRVAFLGVGGGRGLLSIPHPSKNYLAIERDPSVVDYFTRLRPEDNDHIFEKLTVVAGDGRHVLEQQSEPFDVIVFESARYQPAHSLLPASAPHHLYTKESLATAVSRLKSDGWIVLGFTEVHASAFMEYLPIQVAATLVELGLQVQTFVTTVNDHVHVVGCRTSACIDNITHSAFGRHGPWHPQTSDDAVHDYRLTDATPFGAWATMSLDDKEGLLAVVGLVALACVTLGGRLIRGNHHRHRWNPTPYFFTIGIAQAVFAVATCYLWRSYWQDDVLTVVRVLVYLIAFGAIGSALSARLPVASWPVPVRVVATAAIFTAHFIASTIIPFESSSTLYRELMAGVLLAPGGLLMGTFFPLGVASAARRLVGQELLADALGALVGYTLLYLVALPFGVHAFAATSVVGYAVAATLWRPGASEARGARTQPGRAATHSGKMATEPPQVPAK